MNYKRTELIIDNIREFIAFKASQLDPEISGQDDLIYELERMDTDLKNAVNRIETLKKLENEI